MSIYTRDNINYGGMLQTALQNKANYLKNRYDRVAQTGQNWGNALKQTGNAINDAIQKYAYTKWGYDQDKDKLAIQQQFKSSEAEKRALEALQRQQEQQKFQEAQNELNRQNTYNIALLNKSIANDEKKDSYQLNYQKAANTYNLLATELNKDPNNINLQKQVNDAEFDVEYWAKKAGRKIETTDNSLEFSDAFLNEATQSTQPTAATYDNSDAIKTADAYLNSKSWTNDTRQKFLNAIGQIQDQAIKEQYMQKMKDKGLTVEDRQQRRAETIKNWKLGMPVPAGYKIVYKAGKAYLQ